MAGSSSPDPTRAWEVARTVVAPPSSVVKCLWEVFVWGVVLVVCVCVSVLGVLFSVGVCACDLLIFWQENVALISRTLEGLGVGSLRLVYSDAHLSSEYSGGALQFGRRGPLAQVSLYKLLCTP